MCLLIYKYVCVCVYPSKCLCRHYIEVQSITMRGRRPLSFSFTKQKRRFHTYIYAHPRVLCAHRGCIWPGALEGRPLWAMEDPPPWALQRLRPRTQRSPTPGAPGWALPLSPGGGLPLGPGEVHPWSPQAMEYVGSFATDVHRPNAFTISKCVVFINKHCSPKSQGASGTQFGR